MPEQRTIAVDIDELRVLADAIGAFDVAGIAVDSFVAGQATMRSALELLQEAGQLASRAMGAGWAWLDERRAP
jgi:hypothetical protein